MKILGELNFEDAGDTSSFQVRRTARSVVHNADNMVALLAVTKGGYHKLPGGGIDEGETAEIALRRECKEELGCDVKIDKYLGCVIEIRPSQQVRQESEAFLAHLISDIGGSAFTEEERNAGYEIRWLPLMDAINQLSQEIPTEPGRRYVPERDLLILKAARDCLA